MKEVNLVILQEKRVRVKFLFCTWICLAVAGMAFWSYRHPVLPVSASLLSATHPVFLGWGQTAAAGQDQIPSAKKPHEIHLPLRFVGVLLEEQGGTHSPIAVIQDIQRWKMNLYEAGQFIAPDIVVTRVAQDEVTLNFLDGRSAVLPLQDPTSESAGRGLVVSCTPAGDRIVERQAMQKEAVPVFLEMIQKAIVSPMRWKGLPEGAGMGGPPSEGILRTLGLEKGDRIVAINGSPLEGYRHALQLLVEAVQGASLTIELIRDGTQNRKLTYRLTP